MELFELYKLLSVALVLFISVITKPIMRTLCVRSKKSIKTEYTSNNRGQRHCINQFCNSDKTEAVCNKTVYVKHVLATLLHWLKIIFFQIYLRNLINDLR